MSSLQNFLLFMKEFWTNHKKKIIIGLVAIVSITGAVILYKKYKK